LVQRTRRHDHVPRSTLGGTIVIVRT
jgi:hypothetical protein